jgi:hypothetical protein
MEYAQEESRIKEEHKVREELIHFMREDFSDIGYDLCIYPDGTAYVEIVDGNSEEAKSKFTDIGTDKRDELAEKILDALGNLEMKAERGCGASETVMRVNNYKGRTKGIGFNEKAPNEKLRNLEKELLKMCHDLVKEVEWKKFYPFGLKQKV